MNYAKMKYQIEITTDRLLLSGITPDLIHALYSTKSKAEILDFFGFEESDYQHFKMMHQEGMEAHRHSMFFFLLIHKETGLPIGECGFHSWNKAHNRAELFYKLRSDADKRQGLMTEALKVVLKYAFSELGLHRVTALVASSNTPSVKLLQRYGFTKEGTMREDYLVDGRQEDSDCYSLLKWEWAAAQGPVASQQRG